MIADFKSIMVSMRLKQWIKNIFILAPLLFSERLFELQSLLVSIRAFFSFCLISSAIYIINDIHDKKSDSFHPKKRDRPIASGKIGIKKALILVIILLISGYSLALHLNFSFILILIFYVILNLFYTYIGKSLVFIDAFCISLGFVLRVMGGSYAISVYASGWIIMCTFFIALFLGFGKRRNELLLLKKTHSNHRKVLKKYDAVFLNHVLISCGTISIISYALYTLDPSIIKQFGTDKLIFTVPFVAYGIFRYMYLLWNAQEGDPTDLVTKDRNLLITIFLWVVTTISIIYIFKGDLFAFK